ncbi:uncharacterized protein LOC112589542, partial [Harpegnathos saltator]|uniref:uncharacterized protein LOC112589542 n=1 Tax=Harpegnathos saltator TaxID=610380 RepID=UPI000DBEE9FD
NHTKSTFICSEHFEKECYTVGSFFRRTLKKNAVPTIFRETEESKENINICQVIQTSRLHASQQHNNELSIEYCPQMMLVVVPYLIQEWYSQWRLLRIIIVIYIHIYCEICRSWKKRKRMTDVGTQIEEVQSCKKIKKDVAVQVEKRLLPLSPKETQTKRRLVILQKRLRRRDKSIASMKALIAHLK